MTSCERNNQIGNDKRNSDSALSVGLSSEGRKSVYSYLFDSERRGWIGLYSNVANRESFNIVDLGRQVFTDRLDLNLNTPVNAELVNVDYNDVSVLDMLSIGDISEDIYRQIAIYNRFVQTNYEVTNIGLPNGVNPQYPNYAAFIEPIRAILAIRRISPLEVVLGLKGFDDNDLGDIAQNAYRAGLGRQLAIVARTKAAPILINNPIRGIRDRRFSRVDYDITVKDTRRGRLFDNISDLFAVKNLQDYIPKGSFGIDVPIDKDDSLSQSNRIAKLLEFTGKGQQSQYERLMNLNKYRLGITGTSVKDNRYYETSTFFDSNGYTTINPTFFTTRESSGYEGKVFDPAGVKSIYKLSTVGIIFSDQFHFMFNDDLVGGDILWNRNPKFNLDNVLGVPQSLLRKTQEIVKTSENRAFIDSLSKEFTYLEGSNSYTISRADATTASGSWEFTEQPELKIQEGEYFRVWTKEIGYNRLNRTLRHRGLDNQDKRSVLNDNGLLNIAPTLRTPDKFRPTEDLIKRYMFSLENLAWADHLGDLPDCEQGIGDPVTGHRGRIMWFPPYNLVVDESTAANYQPHEFIGRSEALHTYTNSARTGTINFSIIVDHPKIVNKIRAQRTEFWERYFKGDKLVEAEALKIIQDKLSPNEKDELERARRAYIRKRKRKPKPKPAIVPDNNLQNEDDGTAELGEKILSVYFPNAATVIPYPIELPMNVGQDDFSRNFGYEDGGKQFLIDGLGGVKYEVDTMNGVRYYRILKNGNKELINTTSSGSGKGIPFTYDSRTSKGGIKKKPNTPKQPRQPVLPVDLRVSKSLQTTRNESVGSEGYACPNGHSDRNNFGLNVPYYYNYVDILTKKFVDSGFKKFKVTVVGSASGAITGQITNEDLSLQRAENLKKWFELVIKGIAPNVEIEKPIQTIYLADKEDTDNITSFMATPQTYTDDTNICFNCDQPDKFPCKRARRADIYVKALDEVPEEEEEPTPPIEEDDDSDVEYEPDEIIPDPNFTPPEISQDILDKLLYTECDFFNYMEVYEPATYGTISERIKYFHPAYHSITPQGFNSRLTFLHQCMKQSDNIGVDGLDNTRNLAFGRMPVCILRIGDFYHTKILITNYSINYASQMTWDLNPEGIGVQPMWADISLSVTFLGGSSMAAPINRLQNALSFNYFANTEMYDIRADSIIFPEGLGFDEKTQAPFKAKILDGIRLSRITGGSNVLANKNIEELRRQFRVANDAQIGEFTGDGDLPQSFASVPELLELKRRLNLPLTEEEKKQLQVVEYDANGNIIRKDGKPVVKIEKGRIIENSQTGEKQIIDLTNGTKTYADADIKTFNGRIIPNTTFSGQIISNDPTAQVSVYDVVNGAGTTDLTNGTSNEDYLKNLDAIRDRLKGQSKLNIR